MAGKKGRRDGWGWEMEVEEGKSTKGTHKWLSIMCHSLSWWLTWSVSHPQPLTHTRVHKSVKAVMCIWQLVGLKTGFWQTVTVLMAHKSPRTKPHMVGHCIVSMWNCGQFVTRMVSSVYIVASVSDETPILQHWVNQNFISQWVSNSVMARHSGLYAGLWVTQPKKTPQKTALPSKNKQEMEWGGMY